MLIKLKMAFERPIQGLGMNQSTHGSWAVQPLRSSLRYFLRFFIKIRRKTANWLEGEIVKFFKKFPRKVLHNVQVQ